MTTLNSTSLTACAATSIFVSGWSAGMSTGLSLLNIPSILSGGASSGVMLRQWKFQFVRGKATMPALAVLCAINYGAVAYHRWGRGLEWRGFAAAGASTLLIVPFTLTFMMRVNNTLLAALESQDKMLSDESARLLLKNWGDLNLVRAVFLAAGTGLALCNLCL